MQIPLYQALKSINISDDEAKTVVEAVESYIAMKITEANGPLIAKLDGMQAASRAETGSLRWMMGLLVTVVTLAALGAAIIPHLSGH